MGLRNTIRAKLTAQDRARLERLCAGSGMTQMTVLSRLIEWFAAQPVGLRSLILSRAGAFQQTAAGQLLRRLEQGLPEHG